MIIKGWGLSVSQVGAYGAWRDAEPSGAGARLTLSAGLNGPPSALAGGRDSGGGLRVLHPAGLAQ